MATKNGEKTDEEKFEEFYRRGKPSTEQLYRAVLHALEQTGCWPPPRGETSFWRLNKVSLAVLAIALQVPYPVPIYTTGAGQPVKHILVTSSTR